MSPAISPEQINALVRDMVFGTDAKTKQSQIQRNGLCQWIVLRQHPESL